MMGTKAKLICGDEYEAFTRARKWFYWKPGDLKLIKRRFWKRTRKGVKLKLRALS